MLGTSFNNQIPSVNKSSADTLRICPGSVRIKLLLFIFLVLGCNTGVHSAWREASSDHFLIYADDSERDIRRFSEKLERYRRAMEFIFPFPDADTKPSPSNRVTIYVVGSRSQVRRLYGDAKAARFITGFYVPRAGGSLAIIPSVNASRRSDPTRSELILMHEYAHHYLRENASYIIPRWFSEGFAEYFSYAKFERDGAVGLGLPANSRANEFYYASKVSLSELLDVEAYAARTTERYNNFYARSWLLFHYMYSEEDRRLKLHDYLTRINSGEGEPESAISAFGGLEELNEALSVYFRQRKMKYFQVPPELTVPGEITVRELNEAEAAIMPVIIRSKRGVDEEEAAEVIIAAREVAEKYPDDPKVLAALAEAEFDAGNDEGAIDAADRSLARNPVNIDALVQKGYALTRIARETQEAEAWENVRGHFISLNKIETDHPIPLIYNYSSYIDQGIEPTESAIQGLERALELAPYDKQARLLVTKQQLNEKRYMDAIRTLNPLVYNPHLDEDDPAHELLEQAKKGLIKSASTSGSEE